MSMKLLKVLMREFPASDRHEETRCVQPKALQLLHGHRRPSGGIADYHHLSAIPGELLKCQDGTRVGFLPIMKNTKLIQEPRLEAAGVSEGSDPGQPLEHRRRCLGCHPPRRRTTNLWQRRLQPTRQWLGPVVRLHFTSGGDAVRLPPAAT